MKLLFVYGTRPEAIKLAPVILEARRRGNDGVSTVVVSTGQHREMLRPIIDLFGITPDIDLDLMQSDQTLTSLTASALTSIGEIFLRHRPSATIVQGDTSTAMAGALASYYHRIPVAHVEAGLRTNNIYSPYPEEINRRVIGQIARWHLAPTERAKENLIREQLPPSATPNCKINVTGNTVIDALRLTCDHLRLHPSEDEYVDMGRRWKSGSGHQVILVTGHRRENFGKPFEDFCLGLLDLAEAHPEALIIYPVHLNPNVQRPVRALLAGKSNIILAPALEYPAFVALMNEADLVITDSGGVQEEAPWLGIPVIVTRTTTERPEAVEAGGVMLVAPDRRRIFDVAHRLLTDREAYRKMALRRSPYGDGFAARRCLDALLGLPVEQFFCPPHQPATT